MRSCENYQSIKTPEDEEYEDRVQGAFAELCDIYADEIAEQGMNCYQKAQLIQRARKMAENYREDEE